MANDPLTQITTHTTVQTAPIPGRTDQVINSAGGFVFEVSPKSRLERFLILGTEGGTYYLGEKELTKDNAEFLISLAGTNPQLLLEVVRDVSLNGRAYKQNPTLFALAVAASFGTPESKAAALKSVSEICRTGTMLFKFNQYVEQFRGRGRALNGAVKRWYLGRGTPSLENQLVKYQQRDGWAHRDLLRLAKPKPDSEVRSNAFRWAAGKEGLDLTGLPTLQAFEALKTVGDNVGEAVRIITEAQLPWEAVPSELLKHPEIWEALVPQMGLTALTRNLGRLTANGWLKQNSASQRLVVEKLSNAADIAAQRVHPMQFLLALTTYQGGQGQKGSLKWAPVPAVIDVVEEAFYLSFGNVEPTDKRRMLSLDTSGSMSNKIMNTNLSCCMATAAMCMTAVRTEKSMTPYTMNFAGNAKTMGALPFTPRTTLIEATRIAQDHNWGTTDCSLPFQYALERGLEIDSFEVYTDNETYAGRTHPVQALAKYRRETGINATLTVVGMTATNFTIADPKDPGMLDVVGFDASAPAAIAYFITSV